jgi:hypothetical protein
MFCPLLTLIELVVVANAEPMPNTAATKPRVMYPFDDFLRFGAGEVESSKRSISMLTP